MIRCKWEPGVIYDQGKVEACTGYAWSTALRCKWGDDTDDPITLYKLGYKRHYGNTCGLGSQGISPAAIAGAFIEAGYLKGLSYMRVTRWTTEYDLQQWIYEALKEGPLLLAIEWFQGFTTRGTQHMEATGEVDGNHLVVALDACSVRGLVIQNSHGPRWGDQGRKFIKWRLLLALLKGQRADLMKINW